VDEQQQSPWRPTRRQLLWIGGIVAVLAVAVVVGYRYGITLWDWLKLLVVPAVIAGGGIWFNRQQRERELEIAEQRTKEDRKIAQVRTEAERQLAEQRRQDDVLQAYIDQMGQLMLDKDRPLRQSEERSEVNTLARARTLTVLRQLDSARKGRVIEFLYEADLIISKDDPRSVADLLNPKVRPGSVLALYGADLRGANLSGDVLQNLWKANLRGADLRGANLWKANLSAAKLTANLAEANLREATLQLAYLADANLSGADLSGANLREAFMLETNLTAANLTGAVGWTEEQLLAASLEGATMPNGQKYEDWLKSKGRGKDGENSGPS
jgi:hypothetical protein